LPPGRADGLRDALRQPRLSALATKFRRNLSGLLSAARETRGDKHIAGKLAGAQFRLRCGPRHPRSRGGLRLRELGGNRGAQRAVIEVDDAHRRDGTAAAKQIAEQPQNDEGRTEEQPEGPPVAAELLEDAAGDGRDRPAARLPPASASLRKASSRRSTPAWPFSSATVPSASNRPNRISPSRSQPAASSIPCLETTIGSPP